MTKEELSSVVTSAVSNALDLYVQKEKTRDTFIMKKLNDCATVCNFFFFFTLVLIAMSIVTFLIRWRVLLYGWF